MNAWQQAQQAQKEEERKAKTDAVQGLQGYRRLGLSQDEKKVAALREQERIHKLNAEEQLRGYRGELSEEDKKVAAQKQEELRRKKELESQLRNSGVVSANDPNTIHNLPLLKDRKVSELAAGYSSPSPLKQPHEYEQQRQRSTPVTISMTSDSSSNDNSFRQPDFDRFAATTTDGVVENHHDRGAISTTIEEKRETMEEESIVFMFGILTANDVVVDVLSTEDRYKLVDGYLARADQIAKSVAVNALKTSSCNQNHHQHHNSTSDDNFCASSLSTFESIASTLTYPVVKSIITDHSRTDVHRTMVTVAISFSAQNKIVRQSFKREVVERISAAILDGRFTKVFDDNK